MRSRYYYVELRSQLNAMLPAQVFSRFFLYSSYLKLQLSLFLSIISKLFAELIVYIEGIHPVFSRIEYVQKYLGILEKILFRNPYFFSSFAICPAHLSRLFFTFCRGLRNTSTCRLICYDFSLLYYL